MAEDLVRQRLGLSAGDVVIPPLEGFTEDKMPYHVVGGLSTVSEADNNVSESSPPPECNMSVTDVHRAYLQQEIAKDPNASSQTLQASFEKSFQNEPQLSPDKRQEFIAKLNTSIAYQKRQYFEKSGEFLKCQTIDGLQKLVEKSNLFHHVSEKNIDISLDMDLPTFEKFVEVFWPNAPAGKVLNKEVFFFQLTMLCWKNWALIKNGKIRC